MAATRSWRALIAKCIFKSVYFDIPKIRILDSNQNDVISNHLGQFRFPIALVFPFAQTAQKPKTTRQICQVA